MAACPATEEVELALHESGHNDGGGDLAVAGGKGEHDPQGRDAQDDEACKAQEPGRGEHLEERVGRLEASVLLGVPPPQPDAEDRETSQISSESSNHSSRCATELNGLASESWSRTEYIT